MADAYGINWGAIEQPNILGNYLQGRQVRQEQENALFDRQRQEKQDARSEEEWGLKKQAYADDRQKSQLEIAQARGKTLTSVAQRLKSVTPGQRKAALDQAAPLFQASGIDPATFANLTEEQLSDQALDVFVGNVDKELQFFQTDRGIYAGDRATGRVELKQAFPGKPIEMDPAKNYYLPDDGAGPAQPTQNAAGAGGGGSYRDAIASIESRGSGDYKALGPVTAKGDRAYGRYQVMGANIPQWTKEVLGRAMTPQEFIASPQAQDAVFDAKFGGFVQQYGSPEDAASVWFTGKPRAQGAGRRDQLGTSGAEYVQKFSQNLGGVSGGQGASSLPGGAGGDTMGAPQIPGMRLIQQGRVAPEWQSDGQGNLINTKTGDRKRDLTINGGEDPIPAESGLIAIGKPGQGLYRNAVGQKFQTNRAGTIQRLGGPTDEQVGKVETKITAINETLALVDAVDTQLKKTRTLGPGGRYIVNQEELARLDSLTKQLQIAYKNAAELGAITGPDVPFIEAVAPNPRELMALVQRGEFKPRLESLAKVAGTKYRAQTASFRALGGDPNGLTPLYQSPNSRITMNRDGTGAKPKAPKVGEVRRGFRFKGGDPSKPSSWQKAQ